MHRWIQNKKRKKSPNSKEKEITLQGLNQIIVGSFKITGGKKLKGEISPQGAKNEVLQILCAVLLTKDEVRISNIPDILDVNKLI